MISGFIQKMTATTARRAFNYAALMLLTNGFIVLSGGLFNCWAAQSVNVSVSANLQTLVNQYPAATTFSLAPGFHRLQSVTPKAGDAFVGQTGAILSGANQLTTFSKSGSYWVAQTQVTKAGAYTGTCLSTHPACMYPEDLFFNNVPKNRVASLSKVGPGYWYLDYSTGKVYMGDNPSGQTVEISLAGYAFTGGAASVIIENLTIEKYACQAQSAAINDAAGGTYWTIEGNTIRFNHGRGISSGNGMYVVNNNIYSNGQLGMGGGGSNIDVQSNQISYNNYAGYDYNWEAGGIKFSNVRNLTVRYNYSHNNAGPGYWNDIDSQYVTYDQNQASSNIEAGIMSEISSNITISNNYIWNDAYNPSGSGIWNGGAILISNSSDVSVYSNSVSSSMNGIVGILANRGDGPNGQPYLLQNVNVNSNHITQNTGFAVGIAVEGSGFDNSVYTSWNNEFQSNTFTLTNPTGDYIYWMNEPMTLAAWGQLLSLL